MDLKNKIVLFLKSEMTHQSVPPRLLTFTDKIGAFLEVERKDSKYLISLSKPYTEKVFATLPGYRFVSYNLNDLSIKDMQGRTLKSYKLEKQVEKAKSNPSGTAFLLLGIGENAKLILLTDTRKFKINKKVQDYDFGFLTDDYYHLTKDFNIEIFHISNSKPIFSYPERFFYPLYNGYFVAEKENEGVYLFQLVGDEVFEKELLFKYNNEDYKYESELDVKWLREFFTRKGIEFKKSASFDQLVELYNEWMNGLSVLEEEGIIQWDLTLDNWSFNEVQLVCSYTYGNDETHILEWKLKEGKIVGKPKIKENHDPVRNLLLLSDGQLVVNGSIHGKYFENLQYAFCSSDPIQVTKILSGSSKLPSVLITEMIGFL